MNDGAIYFSLGANARLSIPTVPFAIETRDEVLIADHVTLAGGLEGEAAVAYMFATTGNRIGIIGRATGGWVEAETARLADWRAGAGMLARYQALDLSVTIDYTGEFLWDKTDRIGNMLAHGGGLTVGIDLYPTPDGDFAISLRVSTSILKNPDPLERQPNVLGGYTFGLGVLWGRRGKEFADEACRQCKHPAGTERSPDRDTRSTPAAEKDPSRVDD